MEVAMVEAGIESMDGYSEAGGCGNSKTWRQMRSGQKK